MHFTVQAEEGCEWVIGSATTPQSAFHRHAAQQAPHLLYHIRPIKRTVRVQVGKFFCSRGFVKHSYNHTPQWVPTVVLRTATRNGQ